ncbi:MAG TPA: histidine phosphatase family protein, partial [Candidatus Saccharimonadales bacterium]|nr:histidine phosphatase family protein [Candidatus Saccharimonadales bacterium]
MSMPNDFILIRHGQSESNLVQKQFIHNPDLPAPEGYFERHDSHTRLSVEGESQALSAGTWLRENGQDSFDRYYVSPHIRARETAAHLAINGTWRIDDRLRERDWGEYHVMEPSQREKLYPYSNKVKDQSSWYWSPPGGESMATEGRLRIESVLGSLHREMNGQRVIAVTHGEMMIVARFILERLAPEELTQEVETRANTTHNCQILHYSRIN